MRKKFRGQFDALTKMGAPYHNGQRFRPLGGDGKPLWEFKEFDHRLYVARFVTGSTVVLVLLSGWVKEKRGRTEIEDREIRKAMDLYYEFLKEYPGGRI
jgi:hypothetical protein